MEDMKRLGHKCGKLLSLVHNDLLPLMPMDPEALFLASCAQFIQRKWGDAMKLMQTSLMATDHLPPKRLAARNYFLACCAIKVATESNENHDEGAPIKPGLEKKRLDEGGALILALAVTLTPTLVTPTLALAPTLTLTLTLRYSA